MAKDSGRVFGEENASLVIYSLRQRQDRDPISVKVSSCPSQVCALE